MEYLRVREFHRQCQVKFLWWCLGAPGERRLFFSLCLALFSSCAQYCGDECCLALHPDFFLYLPLPLLKMHSQLYFQPPLLAAPPPKHFSLGREYDHSPYCSGRNNRNHLHILFFFYLSPNPSISTLCFSQWYCYATIISCGASESAPSFHFLCSFYSFYFLQIYNICCTQVWIHCNTMTQLLYKYVHDTYMVHVWQHILAYKLRFKSKNRVWIVI